MIQISLTEHSELGMVRCKELYTNDLFKICFLINVDPSSWDNNYMVMLLR